MIRCLYLSDFLAKVNTWKAVQVVWFPSLLFQIGKVQVWMKTLQSYEYAVAFLNEDDKGTPKNVTINMGSIGLLPGIYDIEDIYTNKDFMDFSTDDKFSILVPPNGCRFLHLYPSERKWTFKSSI